MTVFVNDHFSRNSSIVEPLSLPFPILGLRCTLLRILTHFACLAALLAMFPRTSTAELFFSSLVPAPRQLTLERQLNKSVLIGWTAPEGVQQANIESYHVYVDGVLKTTVKASERTRALVEGVDSNRVSSFRC